MNKTFDEERFDFFTAEDNFLQMHRIAEHLPAVKSQLLLGFWDAVERKLKDKYFREGDVWKVKRLEPLTSNISKLMIYKPVWGTIENDCPQIAISCEQLTNNPFYGPFIHNRVKTLSVGKANKYLQDLSLASQYRKSNTYWYPFWGHLSLTFTDLESFRLILPVNLADAVDSTAGQLHDMCNALEDALDHVNLNCRTRK